MEQRQVHGGNQQESRLCWLGGVIDSDGCITINHHRLHKGQKGETLLFKPLIIVINTNPVLIELTRKTLETDNIPFYVQYRSNPKGGRKPVWYVRIEGIKRCIKALNVLEHYILAKQDQVKLLKEFCESRLRRKAGGNEQREYTEKDFEIIYKMAEIHNRNPQRLYAEIRKYRKQQRRPKRDRVSGRFMAK